MPEGSVETTDIARVVNLCSLSITGMVPSKDICSIGSHSDQKLIGWRAVLCEVISDPSRNYTLSSQKKTKRWRMVLDHPSPSADALCHSL